MAARLSWLTHRYQLPCWERRMSGDLEKPMRKHCKREPSAGVSANGPPRRISPVQTMLQQAMQWVERIKRATRLTWPAQRCQLPCLERRATRYRKGRCGNTATRNLALRLRQSAPLGASRQSDCAPAGHRSERKNQKGRWPLLTGQPMLRAGLLTIAMTTWWCPAIHLRPAALKIFFSELPDCSSACQQIFP